MSHDRLTRSCFIDYDRETVLIAEWEGITVPRQIIAVGRLTKVHSANEAELAVIVSDAYQGLGLGKELVRLLIVICPRGETCPPGRIHSAGE